MTGLDAYLTENDMTAAQFARRMTKITGEPVSHQMIQYIRRGKRKPSTDMIVGICATTGWVMTPNDVLFPYLPAAGQRAVAYHDPIGEHAS